MRRVLKALMVVVLMMLLFGSGWLLGRLGIGSAVEHAQLSDPERQFAERMRDVTMVGSFTVAGREEAAPRPDRYDISSVEKVGDGMWRFIVRMDCCGVSGATIPVVVPIRWTGDTPMITMTDLALPGLGTFSVRLLFYGDRYAGTWQHGLSGGSMSGHIESRRSTP